MAAKGIARSWCFTLNNYTAEEEESIRTWESEIQYVVVGHEVGEAGTKHLQGAVNFKGTRRLAAVKKLLPRAHWEPMKAKGAEGFDYCKKDGDWWDIGEYKGQGKRSDLEIVYDAVQKKKSLASVAFEHHLGYQALKTAQLLKGMVKPSAIVRNVIWCYGPTGTGKSMEAYEAGAHFMSREGAFWTEYNGETIVCLDDLRPSEITRGLLLRILDCYPIQVNVKGRMEWWYAETIYITTPFTPKQFWEQMKGAMDDKVDQLLRRITTVKEFIPGGNPAEDDAAIDLVRSEEVVPKGAPIDLDDLPIIVDEMW